jgi:hypothetical protein
VGKYGEYVRLLDALLGGGRDVIKSLPNIARVTGFCCLCAGRLLLLLMCAALSWGWCVPLTRDSAVCEQSASHNTQIMACFSHRLDWAPFLKT